MSTAPVPDVSVIIGAYNAMPYFTQCITSVLRQTIGHERMEVILVDDGSTDGTGEEIDRYAELHPAVIKAIHQPNSGGPAAPRNVGIERARGRYLFFLDADDYLGDEALERMTAMADEQQSDVILGKMVGVGGRGAPASMYKKNQPDADLFSSRVYWTLGPMKLFRRTLIEEHGLRFDTTLKTGEDQPFTAMAYLKARRISVVADYECVYAVKRDDGGNTTSRVVETEPRIRILTTMLPLVGEHTKPGRERDHLMYRHLTLELHRAFQLLVRESDHGLRARFAAELGTVVREWHSDALYARLPAIMRLQYHFLVAQDLDRLIDVVTYVQQQRKRNKMAKMAGWHSLMPSGLLVEDDRVYAQYPYFRDATVDVPDSVFDLTAEIPRDVRVTAVEAGAAEIRLHGDAVPAAFPRQQSPKPARSQALVCPAPTVTGVDWTAGAAMALTVSGTFPTPLPAGKLYLTATTGSGHSRVVRVKPAEDRSFSASVTLGRGDWTIGIRLEQAGRYADVALTPEHTPTSTKRIRSLRPWYGRPLAKGPELRVRVGRINPVRAARKRIGL